MRAMGIRLPWLPGRTRSGEIVAVGAGRKKHSISNAQCRKLNRGGIGLGFALNIDYCALVIGCSVTVGGAKYDYE